MNKIEKVPDSIYQLKDLEILDLSFNNLTSIPASIFYFCLKVFKINFR